MKYLLPIITMCILIAGCVTKQPRFNPNAKLKGKNVPRHVQKNTKPSHGDALGKRIDAAQKRIKKAVEEGKMTPEQGKEMLDALKKRARRARKNI